MNAVDRRYKKIAGMKAKEYLRNKRKYKTKAEKKAFRLAEKFRIDQWRKELEKLDAGEKAARLKAFRYYNIKRNFLPLLICGALLLALLLAALIVLL